MKNKNIVVNKIINITLSIFLIFLMIFGTTEPLFFVKADTAGFSSSDFTSGSTSTNGYWITSTTNVDSNVGGYRFSILHRKDGLKKCIPANTITVLRDDYDVKKGNIYVWRTKIDGDAKILSHVYANEFYSGNFNKNRVNNNCGFSLIKNIYTQTDSHCINRMSLNGGNGINLPNLTADSNSIADAVNAWESNTNAVNNIIKAIGNKCGNDAFATNGKRALLNGEILTVEPLFKVTLNYKECLMSMSDIAQYWAGQYGWDNAYKNNSADDSGKTNKFLSNTFRSRYPNWYRILGTGDSYKKWLSAYRTLVGNKNASLLNETNGKESGDTTTPKDHIKGFYGMGFAFYQNNIDFEKKLIIYFNRTPKNLNDSDYYPGAKDSKQSFGSKNNLLKEDNTKFNETFTVKTQKGSSKPVTFKSTPNSLFEIKEYTKWTNTDDNIKWYYKNSSGNYISSDKAVYSGDGKFGKYKNAYVLAEKLGVPFRDDRTNETKEVTVYPNISFTKANFKVRITDNQDNDTASIDFNNISFDASAFDSNKITYKKVKKQNNITKKQSVFIENANDSDYLFSQFATKSVNLSKIADRIHYKNNNIDRISWKYANLNNSTIPKGSEITIKSYDTVIDLLNALQTGAKKVNSEIILEQIENLKTNDVDIILDFRNSASKSDGDDGSDSGGGDLDDDDKETTTTTTQLIETTTTTPTTPSCKYNVKYKIGTYDNGSAVELTKFTAKTNYSFDNSGNINYNESYTIKKNASGSINILPASTFVNTSLKYLKTFVSINGGAGIRVNNSLSYADIINAAFISNGEIEIKIYYIWELPIEYIVKYKIGNIYRQLPSGITPVPFMNSYDNYFKTNNGYYIDESGYICKDNGEYYTEIIRATDLVPDYLFKAQLPEKFIDYENSKVNYKNRVRFFNNDLSKNIITSENSTSLISGQISSWCNKGGDEIIASYLWSEPPYVGIGVQDIATLDLSNMDKIAENRNFAYGSNNGIELNVDKLNLIRVNLIPKTNDLNYFTNGNKIKYSTTLTVNYCPNGEKKMIYKLTLSGEFTSKDDVHCFFIGNRTFLGYIDVLFYDERRLDDNGNVVIVKTAEEKIIEILKAKEQERTGQVSTKKYSVFFAENTDDDERYYDYLIGGGDGGNSIQNDFINAISGYMLNDYSDFEENASNRLSLNRFSIELNTDYVYSLDKNDNYIEGYLRDEYIPYNTENARYYFFLSPSVYNIEAYFKSIKDINTEGFRNLQFAYSGQIINETNILKTSALGAYFKAYFSEDIIDYLNANCEEYLYDEKYIVDNNGKNSDGTVLTWEVCNLYANFTNTLLEYCKNEGITIENDKVNINDIWVANGEYYCTSVGLYYPNFQETAPKVNTYRMSKDGEFTLSSIPVYPIDLIAPSSSNNNANHKPLNDNIKLFGWYTDDDGIEHKEVISDNLKESVGMIDLSEYDYLSLSSGFTIKINKEIDKYNKQLNETVSGGFTVSDGTTETGILTDISVNVLNNGVGHICNLSDFEFSDSYIKSNNYDKSLITFSEIKKEQKNGFNYYYLPFETTKFKLDRFESDNFNVSLSFDFANNVDVSQVNKNISYTLYCETCDKLSNECVKNNKCYTCDSNGTVASVTCYIDNHNVIDDEQGQHKISLNKAEIIENNIIHNGLYSKSLNVFELNHESLSKYDKMKFKVYNSNYVKESEDFIATSNSKHDSFVNHKNTNLTEYKRGFEVSSGNNESSFATAYNQGTINASLNSSNNVRRGTSTILSLKVENTSTVKEFTSNNPAKLSITGKFKDEEEHLIDVNLVQNIVLPKAKYTNNGVKSASAISSSKLFIPDDIMLGDYVFTIRYLVDGRKEKLGKFTLTVSDSIKYNSIDTTFTKNKPNDFDEDAKFILSEIENIDEKSALNIIHDKGNISWQTYEYDDEKQVFYKVKNNLEFIVNKNTVKSEINNKNPIIGAGYGVTLSFDITPVITINKFIESYGYENGEYFESETLISTDKKIYNDYNSFVSTQNVIAYFPEFNYLNLSKDELNDYIIGKNTGGDAYKEQNGWNLYTDKDTINDAVYGSCATMVKDSGEFVLPYNTSTLTRAHYVPIWYPDTDKYNIVVVANEIWTPVGMVSVVSKSDNIGIEGTLFNDWTYSVYSYIPGQYELEYFEKIKEFYKEFDKNNELNIIE